VDKRHKTITTSLWLNLKFCIQTILETLQKSKAWCITKIHLICQKLMLHDLLILLHVILLLAHKIIIKICHYVLHKNVMTICWNHCVAIHLGSNLCQWSVLPTGHFYNPSFVHG
jgi:hypothetical protein